MSFRELIEIVQQRKILEKEVYIKNKLKNLEDKLGLKVSEIDLLKPEEWLDQVKEVSPKVWKKLDVIYRYPKDPEHIEKDLTRVIIGCVENHYNLNDEDKSFVQDYIGENLIGEPIEPIVELNEDSAYIMTWLRLEMQREKLVQKIKDDNKGAEYYNCLIDSLIEGGLIKQTYINNDAGIVATAKGVRSLIDYVCNKKNLDKKEVFEIVNKCNKEGLVVEHEVPYIIREALIEANVLLSNKGKNNTEANLYMPFLSEKLKGTSFNN